MPGISDLGGRNGAPKVQVRRKSMPENMELYSEFEDGRNIIGDEPDGVGIGAFHNSWRLCPRPLGSAPK
jgi:hypothetical protein